MDPGVAISTCEIPKCSWFLIHQYYSIRVESSYIFSKYIDIFQMTQSFEIEWKTYICFLNVPKVWHWRKICIFYHPKLPIVDRIGHAFTFLWLLYGEPYRKPRVILSHIIFPKTFEVGRSDKDVHTYIKVWWIPNMVMVKMFWLYFGNDFVLFQVIPNKSLSLKDLSYLPYNNSCI